MARSPEEIVAELDALVAVGRARMEASKDPCIRGLHMSESEWLSREEFERLNELHLEWARSQPTLAEVRERVARKRAARLARMLEGAP